MCWKLDDYAKGYKCTYIGNTNPRDVNRARLFGFGLTLLSCKAYWFGLIGSFFFLSGLKFLVITLKPWAVGAYRVDSTKTFDIFKLIF